jgi:hypothetical protein
MPKNEHLKRPSLPPNIPTMLTSSGVIALAARRAESIMPTYPKHFHSIEDAKKYIATHCENADFTYSPKMNLSYEDEAEVRDKVHYLVAVKAFEQDEFYLDVPLMDRAQLRGSFLSHLSSPLPSLFSSKSTTQGKKVC